MPFKTAVLFSLAAFFASAGGLHADPIAFTSAAEQVACYDYAEITVHVPNPAKNPFTDATLTGIFGPEHTHVTGFCDAADGSVFCIRFMPAKPGDYSYQLSYSQPGTQAQFSGKFQALDQHRSGILRVDPQYPWHFIWEGTGTHYFLNGTTAFFLFGFDDPKVVASCIDRLADAKINRLRVLLYGRSDHTWTEPIKSGHGFHMWLNPWLAQRPDNVNDPGFDFSRFNVAYWQHVEQCLRHARDKDVAISLVMEWNDTSANPQAGSEDEKRYYRYAVARLAAFSNVCWDLGDDLDSFRDVTWTHATGMMLMNLDPYMHLATSHPVNNDHQDRTSPWFTNTSFQEWHRPLHEYMLDERQKQLATGRIIPQVDEEYGYEDHYPSWAPYQPPMADTDHDRRAAWEMAMAGGYQTTGETAKRGTGVPPDTGGGWINGRGDDSMKLVKLQAHLVEFFTSFDYWKTNPRDDLVSPGDFCLADPGHLYAVYVPDGKPFTITLEPGKYSAAWFNPRTGQTAAPLEAAAPKWTSPAPADDGDWAMLLQKKPG